MPDETPNETTETIVEDDIVVIDPDDGSVVPDDTQPPRRRQTGPRVIIDLKKLHAISSLFATYEEIAMVFDCSVATLQARYKREIEKGRKMGKMSIRQEMRVRSKSSDRVLTHLYDKHVEAPPGRVSGTADLTVEVMGNSQRPLIIREVDEDSDTMR